MWPFAKRTPRTLDLSAPRPKDDDEITLLSEDGIPEDLPPLEIKTRTFEMPKEAEPIEEIKVVPKHSVKVEKYASMNEKFMSTENYRRIMSEISNMIIDFDDADFEIGKVVELKEERDGKISSLQNTMEDIGKKLMFVENTLFGG